MAKANGNRVESELMKDETISLLLQLNRSFYDELGPSFSLTRGQIQPGVKQLLPAMLEKPRILDLGCGNGTLAEALALAGYNGKYLGVDGSQSLLGFAEERARQYPLLMAEFWQADLLDEAFYGSISVQAWPLIVCFATLQHFPSQPAHLAFFTQAAKLLEAGGELMLSCWQIHNSERLVKHIQPWSKVGISPEDLETGDLLMDWRGQDSPVPGLRYVHEFREDELTALGEAVGMQLQESFYSDGREGNLALYQIWKKSEEILE